MDYTLITGASSGIGYELALLFAKNGHNLILVSRNKNRLTKITDNLKKDFKIETHIIPIDLSNTNAAEEVFRLVKEKSITVNYLVNNAGFYVKGIFSDNSWDDEQNLIQLQCLTHTQLTKLLLPNMLKQGKGGILNVGSTGSFVPGPHNAIYCAAKSFVLSFSEALAEELSVTGVRVTALCPGGTKTAFQQFDDKKKSFLFPVMKASVVAQAGYKALMKGKRLAIPGLTNKFQVMLVRFIPRKLVTKLTSRMVAN
ncbi:MAG: SDR family oxidoreductase [Bacteroidales bacterium]|nr:SDR family oxidoreductase [Bacteroidales bacterium]